MPYIYNFANALSKISTVTIEPEGWNGPIVIEYATGQPNKYDTMQSICWRVKGTTHTFTIYEIQLNQISKGDYASHFKETLEHFREEYITWRTDPKYFGCKWVDEYIEQYGELIKF